MLLVPAREPDIQPVESRSHRSLNELTHFYSKFQIAVKLGVAFAAFMLFFAGAIINMFVANTKVSHQHDPRRGCIRLEKRRSTLRCSSAGSMV